MTLGEFFHYTRWFFVTSWGFVEAGKSFKHFASFCRGAPAAYLYFMKETHQGLKAMRAVA